MANRKVKNKRKNKKNSNKELIAIILIIVGFISLISLFSSKMGIVGNLFYKLFTFLAGSGNFIFPFLIVFWGFIYGMKKFEENFSKIFISTFIIAICILVFLDGTKNLDLTLIDRISLSMQYLDIARSGGVIGSIFGFFLYKLFGSVGTYIILSLIIIGNLYLLAKVNINGLSLIKDNMISLGNGISSSFNKLKERVKDKSESKEDLEKYNLDIENIFENNDSEELIETDSKEDISIEDIEIKDYNTDQNTEDDTSYNLEENLQTDSIREDKKRDVKTKNKRSLKTKEDIKDNLEFNKTIENINNSEAKNEYSFPPLDLLMESSSSLPKSNNDIVRNGKIIEQTMENFGIDCKIVAIKRGPVITCYEIEPAPGVRLSKIVGLNDNLALSLASSDIRIEAPIPGKSAVGIEVANKKKEAVNIRDIISSSEFKNLQSKLPLALGKDVSGSIIISSIDRMPHLLIAGATGSGKSVCINTIITNILYKSSPEDVKLMLIDPKVVELSVYNGIPHLLIPVVTDPKKASFALNWAVSEMEKRYKQFSENSVRDIKSYNNKVKRGEIEANKMPQILIIIDELADLMMVAKNEVEDYITRLAQMARAAGIHLIIATQRPSVDVITGTIKANIPSRIAFAVSSSVDSRTILDASGAEKLLGKGDMLFYPGYLSKPIRVQGAFISDEEVERVVSYVVENSDYDKKTEDKIKSEIIEKRNDLEDPKDPLFEEALRNILLNEQASISFLQRKLKVGYSRAARIVDQMEESGILGPHEGSKPRKILMSPEEIRKFLGEDDE
ncbi:FtsK/SpoIIIE family DNA translocase [Peptoniphilus obesi]|uniref:FtsK/SpoIIIE family DNA translocase n=1 Tax=Peptoniphilus obesi TaxID=1472765 RepID=UPI0004AEF605